MTAAGVQATASLLRLTTIGNGHKSWSIVIISLAQAFNAIVGPVTAYFSLLSVTLSLTRMWSIRIETAIR